jgi:Tfp pilus assembly protein PilN
MIEINLLPKDLQKKRFAFKLDKNIVMVLSGCIGLLAVMAIYSFVFQVKRYADLEKQLQISKAETERYAPEIAKIDEIAKKKEQILERMSSIEVLDRNREYWVTLMEDIAGRVPEYVWLVDIRQAPVAPPSSVAPGQPAAAPAQPAAAQQAAVSAKSSIEGYSFSLNALATFLVRLKKSDMLNNIEIASIKLQDIEKANAYNFKLTCDMVAAVPKSADVETAQAAGSGQDQF